MPVFLVGKLKGSDRIYEGIEATDNDLGRSGCTHSYGMIDKQLWMLRSINNERKIE